MTRIGDVLQGSRIADQIELETESIQQGIYRYHKLAREAIDRGDGASLKPAERLLQFWFEPLKHAIDAERTKIAKQLKGEPGKKGHQIYGPVLWSLDLDRLVLITLHELVSRCMSNPNGHLILKMTYGIGNAVLAEINYDLMKEEDNDGIHELDRRFKNQTPTRINRWAKKTLADPLWERRVCTHVGAILLHLALEVCKIEVKEEFCPAFIHGKQWRDGKPKGVVWLDPATADVIEDGHLFRQHLRPRFLPMIIPPYPWSAEDEGGYARIRTPFISKPTKEQRTALAKADIETLYETMNAINSTGWKMNTWYTQIMSDLWDTGGGIVAVPRAELEEMPEKPKDITTNPEALKAWKRAAHEVHTNNAQLRGARVEFIQKLSIAKQLADEPVIYYPHQLDFRTRFYPIPATSPNHHGGDIDRGFLLFARSVDLDSVGERQLKIHAANMWGYDKVDFDARVAFIDGRMDELEEIVSAPLDYIEAWAAAENPGQFLVAAKCLFDPEMAACLPGQIDGTFNGGQNYAAAGLDEKGAPLVNMTPSNSPNDAYMDVLAAVCQAVEACAVDGNLIAAKTIKLLEPEVQARSLIKTPSMTTVYNVQRVGARNQIRDKLKKLKIDKEDIYPVSHFLSSIVLDSVGDVFTAARDIMKWIEQCVRMMVKAEPMRTVGWMSPIGTPIIQPYRNIKRYSVHTVVQKIILGHRDEEAPASLSKQVQGGPPNVVHTWDSDHAKLTGLAMYDEDMDYAAVHDAYWSHLNHMLHLHFHTRDQFVFMHKDNQVQRLYEYWSEQYPNLILPKPPPQGSFDLDLVREAPYFFH